MFISRLTALSVLLFAVVFAVPAVFGEGSDNLSGYIWSENIGWIRLNGGTYGVSVASDGTLDGYAWSENIGWISFNEDGGCPTGTCRPHFDRATGKVTGWALAPNGNDFVPPYEDGWEGWISLSGVAKNNSPYGVNVSGCNWDGWAWGSEGLGWIHFRGVAMDGSPYGAVGSGDACTTVQPVSADIKAKDSADGVFKDGPITVNEGSIVTLQWACTPSTASGEVSPYGFTGTSGTKDVVAGGSVVIDGKITATLACSGGEAFAADSVTINVTELTPEMLLDLKARPLGVGSYVDDPAPVNSGGKVEFFWASSYTGPAATATSCKLKTSDGQDERTGLSSSGTGLASAALSADRIYTMECENDKTRATDQVATEVNPSTGRIRAWLYGKPQTGNSTYHSGAITIDQGAKAFLYWRSGYNGSGGGTITCDLSTDPENADNATGLPATVKDRLTQTLNVDTQYTVTCHNDVTSGSDDLVVNTEVPPQTATADIKIKPSSESTYVDGSVVVLAAEPFDIQWSSNAASCTVTSGSLTYTGISGTKTGEKTNTSRTYTLSCIAADGSTVSPDTVQAKILTADIKANGLDAPAPISAGDTVHLSWTSANAAVGSCVVNPGGYIGNNVADKSVVVSSDTTYVLTCANGSRTKTDTVFVDVTGSGSSPPAVDIKVKNSSTESFEDGPITVPQNSTVHLAWETLRAESCLLDGNAVDANIDQSNPVSRTIGTQNKTFSLTCSNTRGDTTDAVTVNVSGGPSCTEDVWECEAWSACQADGTRVRRCNEISDGTCPDRFPDIVEPCIAGVPQCRDGIDNDDDGLTDYSGGDPGCTDPEDNDEREQCSNNVDDDNDNLIDYAELVVVGVNEPADQCTSPTDNDESGGSEEIGSLSVSPSIAQVDIGFVKFFIARYRDGAVETIVTTSANWSVSDTLLAQSQGNGRVKGLEESIVTVVVRYDPPGVGSLLTATATLKVADSSFGEN